MTVMPLYASVGSNDLERASAFYAELLGSIGWEKFCPNPAGGWFFGHPDTGVFAVVTPFDEQPATVGNGTMAGFALPSNEAVDAFHARALSLGATDEGAPGYRGPEEFGAYFSYFRDLDGNKLSAYCWKLPAA